MTRILLGLVLLGAAGLKAHHLATGPVAGEGLLTSRWFQVVWIECEVVLGVWLFSGLYRRQGWAVALGCFGLFAAVTLAKAVRGDASCGCFGRVAVDPWYTLALDLTAVAALLRARRGFLAVPGVPWRGRRLAGAMGVCLLIGIPLGLAAGLYVPARLGEDGKLVGSRRAVLLEPETWVGTPCPLLPHVDVGKRLGRGRWRVVLYHHDCPQCGRRVPDLARAGCRRAGRRRGTKVAMVELAPYAPPGRSLVPPDAACVTGRVSEDRDWFVGTPTVLTLLDGVVLDAREGGHPSEAVGEHLSALNCAPGEALVPCTGGEHDFGYVAPGTVHTVLLGIPNPAGEPLRVTEVRSECACMGAVASDREAPPGGRLPVRVVLRAPDRAQPYAKRILLKTDSAGHPTIPIRIRAAVGLPLEVEPAEMDCPVTAAATPVERSVRIVNRLDRPVRLLYSTSNRPGCYARVPRAPVPARGSVAVPVVLKPGGEGAGRVAVRIQTDLAMQPAVTVTARLGDEGNAEARTAPAAPVRSREEVARR